MEINTPFSVETGMELFDFQLYHNSSHERGFISSARVGISISVSNMAINILILVLIMYFKTTRRQFAMLQIANIALMDLLTIIVVDTITIYYDIYPWSLGQVMCEAWLILDVILPFAAILGIILLNVDRLVFAVKPSLYYIIFKNARIRLMYLGIPWIVSSVLIVPIWLLSEVPMQQIPFMCIYALTESAGLASSVVSLFLPSIIIVILTVLMLITVVESLPKNLHDFNILTFEDIRVTAQTMTRRHNSIVLALCIVNISTLTMQLPFGTISILDPQCLADPCTSIIDLMLALSWLRSSTPGVRALMWFLFTEIKLYCCMCFKSEDERSRRSHNETVPMTSSTHTQHEHIVSSVVNEASSVR